MRDDSIFARPALRDRTITACFLLSWVNLLNTLPRLNMMQHEQPRENAMKNLAGKDTISNLFLADNYT